MVFLITCWEFDFAITHGNLNIAAMTQRRPLPHCRSSWLMHQLHPADVLLMSKKPKCSETNDSRSSQYHLGWGMHMPWQAMIFPANTHFACRTPWHIPHSSTLSTPIAPNPSRSAAFFAHARESSADGFSNESCLALLPQRLKPRRPWMALLSNLEFCHGDGSLEQWATRRCGQSCLLGPCVSVCGVQ